MIKSLELTNIRSFKKKKFEFEEGINLIVGPNGSGKTTVLESIGFMAFGKFLSINQDSFAIREAEQAGRIEAEFELIEPGRAQIGFSRQEKIITVDSVKSPSSRLIGLLPQVFFNPETVELVFGSPALRRRELDMVLTQADHRFVMEILNFRKILKERNALLRSVSSRLASVEELEFWNERFIDLSLKIYSARADLIDFFNRNIGRVFSDICETDAKLRLKYLPSTPYERFAEALVAHQEMDIENGLTSIGPHRDDFAFFLGKHLMREGASRGEQRLAAVAFKATASEYLITKGIRPIIILDDVFSELDPAHQKAVASALKLFQVRQVFISTTDQEIIPQQLLKDANLIRVENVDKG